MTEKNYKVLIIDDSPKNIQVVANFLQNEGYDLSFATDGREAMQILSKESFDLILLDVVMPLIDGFDVCKQISSNSEYKDIPILFLTVKTDPESIIKGFESGGVDYITKPFNPYELLARIRTHLRLKTIQKQLKDNNSRLLEEITLRQKAEKQLKNMNTELEYKVKERTKQIYRLAGIIDQLYESVIITNKDGVIEYVNKAFEADSGFSSDEVIGDIPRFMEKGIYSQNFYDNLWNTIRSGKTWRGSFKNNKKDGTEFEEEITVVPIVNHGNEPDGYFSLKRDVSIQKALEKQLINAQKMEAVGTMAGGIAHDFNNILTAIIGFSEIAKYELNQKNIDCTKIIEVLNASKRAKDLVSQILLLSRKTEIEKKPVRVDIILKEALKLIRSSIPSSIELKSDIEETSGTVTADPTQLHQVIMNLCTNAYQSIEDGKGYLSVSLRTEEINSLKGFELGLKPGKYLKLSVGDNGKKIDASIIDKIFEPYFTTKQTGEGTGLGLAIVNGIIIDLRGIITVKSGDTETVFTVYIPYNPQKIIKDDAESEKEISGGSERIVFLDDEEKICEVGKLILENLGYAVKSFKNPEETLEFIGKDTEGIDLLITDLTMPRLSGLELAEKISAIKPSMPVILLSGFKKISEEELGSYKNIKSYLSKPFNKKELGSIVRKVLDRKIN